MQSSVRSMASGANERVRSTPCPSRVISLRSMIGTSSPPGPTSATSKRTVFVPMSIEATRKVLLVLLGAGLRPRLRFRGPSAPPALFGEALQVEHLFDIGEHHELHAPVFLHVLRRVIAGYRVGFAVARGAPVVGGQPAAATTT